MDLVALHDHSVERLFNFGETFHLIWWGRLGPPWVLVEIEGEIGYGKLQVLVGSRGPRQPDHLLHILRRALAGRTDTHASHDSLQLSHALYSQTRLRLSTHT